jgi:hypothetical protein
VFGDLRPWDWDQQDAVEETYVRTLEFSDMMRDSGPGVVRPRCKLKVRNPPPRSDSLRSRRLTSSESREYRFQFHQGPRYERYCSL